MFAHRQEYACYQRLALQQVTISFECLRLGVILPSSFLSSQVRSCAISNEAVLPRRLIESIPERLWFSLRTAFPKGAAFGRLFTHLLRLRLSRHDAL